MTQTPRRCDGSEAAAPPAVRSPTNGLTPGARGRGINHLALRGRPPLLLGLELALGVVERGRDVARGDDVAPRLAAVLADEVARVRIEDESQAKRLRGRRDALDPFLLGFSVCHAVTLRPA